MSSVVLHSWAELMVHEPAWWKLLEASDQNEATLTPFWLGAWWSLFGKKGRRLRALLVFERGRLIGLVPLLARLHWYRPGLPYRRLELVGSGEDEKDEICSEYLGVLAERGREAEVMRELADALATGRLGRWDEAVFPSLRGGSGAPGGLVAALEHSGIVTSTTMTAECPYIQLPSSWDEYLQKLSSPARHFVKRSLLGFEEWAKDGVEFRVARSLSELEQGSSVLRDLHGQRWAEARPEGVFSSRRFRAFHEQVMRELLRRGALDLSWLLVGGEPIAALYNFVWNRRVYLYQAGRKLDLPATVRPGIVLHLHAIRRAIEAEHLEYDFLGGASQYKLKLATAKRPLLAVRALHSPVLERVRETAERGIDLVRLLTRHA